MKLHQSVIEKLVAVFEMHGGHRNENRLKDALRTLDLAEYTRATGQKILVLTEDLERERAQQE
jgi:hypothetical protein